MRGALRCALGPQACWPGPGTPHGAAGPSRSLVSCRCWPRRTAPSRTRTPAPQQRNVAEHLDDQQHRVASDLGVMSLNPTVEKTVTAKYRASVRVSGWVKLAADARCITK